ncbi:MAG: hypothetical protein O3C49_04885 [Proteobacteria bacterium]|nr:hypothetical protein [Pseudomonadota bacterium]MDA1326384.1 hypothetical protein [Pseudomonadota bacterium]
MQDFDTLRRRVEETAERLSSAQSERQKETQSLVGILRHLEEKYSAQEKQFAYYRTRLEPLEQSNVQLTFLIENLLDLIDSGFGENSLEPLRKASEMAATMLENDIKPLDDTSSDNEGVSDQEISTETTVEATDEIDGETDGEPDAVAASAEPEMATLDDIDDGDADGRETEAVSEVEADAADDSDVAVVSAPEEEDGQVIQDLVQLVEEGAEFAGETPVTLDDVISDEQDESQFAEIADLELEEEPLSYLDDDIEIASDNFGTDIDAVAAADLAGLAEDGEDSQAMAVADDEAQPPVDLVSDDVMPEADDSFANAKFENVSDAVLEMELEEDTTAGSDDLPEMVISASAALTSIDAAEEADIIAALAQAMEEETSSGQAPPPAPADIRSLMLRVEALAKKAEAMRLAQAADIVKSGSKESPVDDQEAQATAAPDKKDSEVAA